VSAHPAAASGRAALAAALDDAPSAAAQAIEVLSRCASEDELRWFGVESGSELPVGAADRLLLAAHEQLLGRRLERTVSCARCGEWTTLPLGRADVGEHWPRSAWCGPGTGLREPSYRDVLAADGDEDVLMARCRTGPGGTASDLDRIEGSLSGPLHSLCVGCGAELIDDVDVMNLVIDALGELRRTVDWEVHLLATTYGWELAAIDALPDERRARLAELASGEFA
jgi:hypothetical protein